MLFRSARVDSIDTLQQHLSDLLVEIDAAAIFEEFCSRFAQYEASGDYKSILRVFNQKSMLTSSNVAQLCGYKNKDAYIAGILNVLRHDSPAADAIRKAVRDILGADTISAESERPRKEHKPNPQAVRQPQPHNIPKWKKRRRNKKRSSSI